VQWQLLRHLQYYLFGHLQYAVRNDMLGLLQRGLRGRLQQCVRDFVQRLLRGWAKLSLLHTEPSQPPLFTSRNRSWAEGRAKTVTFILTHACQLRCTYCYIHDKSPDARMHPRIAQATIDYLLSHRSHFPEPSIVLDFIGGEPLLAVDLMEEISDYFRFETWRRGHPWFENFRLCVTTNGLLYDSPRVQSFIERNKRHLSITVTIDGVREKHDACRVYPTGKGSYDDTLRVIPLWLSQFPNESTKVTVAHNDLPWLCDSVLHLWNLGIRIVNLNTVFEDVWLEGDDLIYEEQLRRLADAYIAQPRYHDRICSVFSDAIGKPLDPQYDNKNWCGAGKMLAVECNGDFYPCIRFAPFSLANRTYSAIGNCFDGVDFNRLRPFLGLDRISQSSQECIECSVASGCAWCQGHNYDAATRDTVFERAVYGCGMHKARVRANEYLRRRWVEERA
jgi:uncharacterized protein